MAAAAVRQAVDAVLFASFKEKVKQTAKASGNRGLGEGERCLFTEHRPAFDAKNRFRLPFELPLEWKPFAECVKKFYFGEPGSQEGGAEPAPPPTEPEPSAASQLLDSEAKENEKQRA